MKANHIKKIETGIKSEHHLSKTLSTLVKEANLNDPDLSRFTGIPVSTLLKLRTLKNSNPTVETLMPIANFFGITIQQLLGLEPILRSGGSFVPQHRKTLSVPILNLAETLSWPTSKALVEKDKSRVWVDTSAKVSDLSYALVADSSTSGGRYPDGAILVFDVIDKINDRDIVIVMFEKRNSPLLRQVIIDADDIYFKPLNPDLGKIIYDEKFTILGIMKQVVINT